MRRAVLWLGLAGALGAGCAPALQRERLTFAVVAGVYYSAVPGADVEAAAVEEADGLLRKTISDLNAMEGLDFVLVAGDLLARAEPQSLDRAKAMLSELRMPYYAVLGEYDGPGPADASAPADAGAGAPPASAAASPSSRSTVIWALQGHGFDGANGYWAQEVIPGLVVVGLDTVQPGGRGGHVDAQQLVWLDRTLAAHSGKMVLVVGHHALVALHPLDEGAAWRHMTVDNAAEVLAVLERHPNVLMVVSAHHHLAGARVGGRAVYLASPSVSVWPLAYHVVRVTPKEVEAVWVPVGTDAQARRAQDRLLASKAYRGVFPAGEDGDTACVRLFGGSKMEIHPLPAIRP